MKKIAALAIAVSLLGAASVHAAEAPTPPSQRWSFDGLFGTFDRAALQRGFQVYKEVCAACHSLNFIRYRDLGGRYGLGYNEDEIKAIAAQYEVTDGPNDQGEMFQRPGRPADKFKAPFPNVKAAAAANNNAAPPDLSLMVEARKGGADYLYAVLTGYVDPPAGVTVMEGLNYNKWFPGHQIAMPKPLNDDQVTYADGTKATVDQMAHDVATFLAWTAEPNMEVRKTVGWKVILYLIIMTGLLYAAKRKIWRDVH